MRGFACEVILADDRIEIYTVPKRSKKTVFHRFKLSSRRRRERIEHDAAGKAAKPPPSEPTTPLSADSLDTFGGSLGDNTSEEVTMVEEDIPRDRLTHLRDEETQETVAYIHFRTEECRERLTEWVDRSVC